MPTYAHIKTDQTDAWYRVLKDSDLEHPEKGVDAYLYLDDLADMHRTALIQRLYSSPEMAELMLAQMDHPEETLKTKKTLYVNKVGGFYPDPTEDEIVEIKEFPQRPLTKDQGFTGWLDATGQFHECTYGTHTMTLHTTITSRTMTQPSISPAQHLRSRTVSPTSLKQATSSQHKLN